MEQFLADRPSADAPAKQNPRGSSRVDGARRCCESSRSSWSSRRYTRRGPCRRCHHAFCIRGAAAAGTRGIRQSARYTRNSRAGEPGSRKASSAPGRGERSHCCATKSRLLRGIAGSAGLSLRHILEILKSRSYGDLVYRNEATLTPIVIFRVVEGIVHMMITQTCSFHVAGRKYCTDNSLCIAAWTVTSIHVTREWLLACGKDAV